MYQDVPGGYLQMNNINISASDPDLEHRVGVAFGTNQTGQSVEFVYNQYSGIAYDIANAYETNDLVYVQLGLNKSYVSAYYDLHPEATYAIFPFDVDVGGPSVVDAIHFNWEEHWSDPAFAIGAARIDWQLWTTTERDPVDPKRANVLSVLIYGTLWDLYDFVYDKNPGQCQVQSGYPTLGTGGKVFKTRFLMGNENQENNDYYWDWD